MAQWDIDGFLSCIVRLHIVVVVVDRIYTALFSALLNRLTALACDSTWVNSFYIYSAFLTIHRSDVLHVWCHMKLQPSRRVQCTPYNHAPCHFMQSLIRKVHAYLAVTCHPHFWHNDWGLLRATAVTRGWNGYRNKSQYRKSTPTSPTYRSYGTMNPISRARNNEPYM